MRSYMRDINLGRETQPHIPQSVGMTEEQIYEMYRLLAIAKYEERYVIPSAYAADEATRSRRCPAARCRSTAGRACMSRVRSARPVAARCPSRWKPSTRCKQRQTGEGMAANAEHPSRVNLLNWDGRGAPDGDVPAMRLR